MEGMIVTALGTALERALSVAEDHLKKAHAVKTANIAACIEYLRAAQSAITGLEDEVDEILVEAKLVARFYWDKRVALYERIDRYLNRDRLRPLLGQAIQGITSCHKFVERDSRGFFQRAEKAEAVAEVTRLLGELSNYLGSLGGTMAYTRENYASASGINMPELLRIQQLLLSQSGSTDDQRDQTTLADLVEEIQSRRVRQGLPLVAESSRIIQELTVVFGLQRSGDG
jgi:hypothetical protein